MLHSISSSSAKLPNEWYMQATRAGGSMSALVVGMGGTLNRHSSTQKAIALALQSAAAGGAETALFAGPDLDLPHYDPSAVVRCERAVALVSALRRADAIIVGSPSYHGSITGLVKNALDYAEDLRGDARPYFDRRVVGCIATAGGWQGAVNTLAALRNVVHALRGWNTPMGVVINTSEGPFDEQGRCVHPRIAEMLATMGRQILVGLDQEPPWPDAQASSAPGTGISTE